MNKPRSLPPFSIICLFLNIRLEEYMTLNLISSPSTSKEKKRHKKRKDGLPFMSPIYSLLNLEIIGKRWKKAENVWAVVSDITAYYWLSA